MTIIRLGRKGKDYMEFSFDNEIGAFAFYAGAKDSYREDDLFISMTEEGEEDE